MLLTTRFDFTDKSFGLTCIALFSTNFSRHLLIIQRLQPICLSVSTSFLADAGNDKPGKQE